MPTWEEILVYVKKTKKIIQESSVLNPIAKGGLKMIPVMGEILLEMWDQSAGPDEDKFIQIVETLNLIEQGNEKTFKILKEKFVENKKEIITNRELINSILFEQHSLLEKTNLLVDKVSEIHTDVQIVDKKLDNASKEREELNKKLAIMMCHVGIDPEHDLNKSLVVSYEDKRRIRELEKKLEKVEIEKTKNVDLLLQRGIFHFYEQEFDVSIMCFQTVLEIDPKQISALNNVGILLEKRGKYADALNLYDKALEIDPNYSIVLGNKATALEKRGKYADALHLFNKALEIDPKHGGILNNKGLLLAKSGKYADALHLFNKALEIDPKDVSALGNKATALADCGKYADALHLFNKALEIDPKHGGILNNKGLLLAKSGKYADALHLFNKALEIDPKDVEILCNKATALADCGKYADALHLADKALEIDPKQISALNNKGLLLAKSGKYADALNLYDKALEIDPNNDDTLYNKSCSYALKGDFSSSLLFLEKVISLNNSWKNMARNDDDFQKLRETEGFKKLLNI